MESISAAAMFPLTMSLAFCGRIGTPFSSSLGDRVAMSFIVQRDKKKTGPIPDFGKDLVEGNEQNNEGAKLDYLHVAPAELLSIKGCWTTEQLGSLHSQHNRLWIPGKRSV